MLVGTTVLFTSIVLGSPNAYAQSHYHLMMMVVLEGLYQVLIRLIIKGVMLMDNLLVPGVAAIL
jgi:hypothetical protein